MYPPLNSFLPFFRGQHIKVLSIQVGNLKNIIVTGKMLRWLRDLFITISDLFFRINNFQVQLSTFPAQFFSTWLGLNLFSFLVLSNGKYFFYCLPIAKQLQIWDWEFVKLLILIISIILPLFSRLLKCLW